MKPEAIQNVLAGLLESLAAIEHERWSHWQRYLHSKCIKQGADGALLIPAELVQRWERQINTPYSALTDKEKESDREQVRGYLPLIAAAFSEAGPRRVTARSAPGKKPTASAKKQPRSRSRDR